jgi:UDP-3-O-[3-hydroxymyristoyl] glucosamine N-acyltransferase
VIRQGVKLDNLVQIAHNVEIGPHTVIAAQSGVAGSSKIGARCIIGGQVGIIGHLKLGDDIQIQGQTGVISNIPDGQVIQGTPAIDFKSFYKSYALFKQLPQFESRLNKLEKKERS